MHWNPRLVIYIKHLIITYKNVVCFLDDHFCGYKNHIVHAFAMPHH